MSFEKNGYELVNDVISKDLLEHLVTVFDIQANSVSYINKARAESIGFGDEQVPNSFSWYGSYWSEALLLQLKPKVEEITGKSLQPNYSYARIYLKDASLKFHNDRPECEYSVTATLKTIGEDWPICLLDRNNNTKVIRIPEGSILIYKGQELYHWRDKMSSSTEKVYQVFLHYVDVNGDQKHVLYDTRPMLGLPPEFRKK